MINIDFECSYGHKFEGCFKDYNTFTKQYDDRLITCPICGDPEIKRVFSGCSIHARKNEMKNEVPDKNLFEQMRELSKFVKENFDNVGDSFADKARAIHYGIEEERNIYGVTTPEEARDLIDEGIAVLPVVEDELIN